MPIAEAFVSRVADLPGVARVEIAGSLRRGQETIGDIDILCVAADAPATIKAFTAFDGVNTVLAKGDTKGSVTVTLEDGKDVQIDLRAVEPDAIGAALQYFTGSKEHNVRLREMAIKKKWRLNEYGLWDGETRLAGKTEEQIYKKLGVPFVPPELREDRGEFDAAAPDDLLTLDHIRGDLHMHTTASDGKNSIEEMAEAAKTLGYDYIAICDHSKSSTIANGLSIARMEKHIEAIRAADKKVKGITILVGCECDILPDGSLDRARLRESVFADADARARLEAILHPLIRAAAAREVATWPLDTPFSIQERMRTVTLTMILRAVLGVVDDSRDRRLRERIHELLDLVQNPIAVLPAFQRELGGRSPFGRLMALVAEIDRMLYEEIGLRRYDPGSSERDDVLSMLVGPQPHEAGFMSDREIRDELLTLLIAGHETTATALAWTV